jgi:hypothetical protein
MERFHPFIRSFWQPVGDALLSGAVFAAAGYLIGGQLGAQWLGATGLLVGYISSWFFWKEILLRSYAPPPIPPPEPLELPDEDAPPIYEVYNAAGNVTTYIRNLPITLQQLGLFARGMIHNPPVPTTYEAWYSVFNQPEFEAWREWMIENHYVLSDRRGRISVTPVGVEFFLNICERGIHLSSPTAAVKVSEI